MRIRIGAALTRTVAGNFVGGQMGVGARIDEDHCGSWLPIFGFHEGLVLILAVNDEATSVQLLRLHCCAFHHVVRLFATLPLFLRY